MKAMRVECCRSPSRRILPMRPGGGDTQQKQKQQQSERWLGASLRSAGQTKSACSVHLYNPRAASTYAILLDLHKPPT
jgi:hypothetical protein